MAARVYADVPGNKCACGGLFSKRVPHPDEENVVVPRCADCDKYPLLFQIDADALDANGAKIRVKIRNDQNNNRLEKISQVLFTLGKIQDEVKDGSFDVNRYASKDAREKFRFKNYAEEYLKMQDGRLARGEITPKGLRDKKGLVTRELLPYFGRYDLAEIKRPLISKFQKSYKEKLRTRDLALGELRTILRQAVKDDMLKVAPEFDPIPKARTRTKIITVETLRRTIDLMPKQLYRDMVTLLSIYPMRPSELRALRWKDLDFVNDKIHVRGHFSDEVWIAGRKSIKEGDKSEIDYPLTAQAREILNRYRPQEVVKIDWQDDFVFQSRFGNHVSDFALAQAWNFARKNAGHTHHLYEIRHRCLTEFAIKTKGDIVKMLRVSGHTNPQTLTERYIRDNSDLSDYF